MDWGVESAFRFFPIEPDPLMGYRLNFWDAGVNKVLALAGRVNDRDLLRDTLDIVEFDRNHLSLGALCWALSERIPDGLQTFSSTRFLNASGFVTRIFPALAWCPDIRSVISRFNGLELSIGPKG